MGLLPTWATGQVTKALKGVEHADIGFGVVTLNVKFNYQSGALASVKVAVSAEDEHRPPKTV